MIQIAEIEFWHRELAKGQDDQCELSHSVRENVPEDTEEVHVTFTLDETVSDIALGSSVILKEMKGKVLITNTLLSEVVELLHLNRPPHDFRVTHRGMKISVG